MSFRDRKTSESNNYMLEMHKMILKQTLPNENQRWEYLKIIFLRKTKTQRPKA